MHFTQLDTGMGRIQFSDQTAITWNNQSLQFYGHVAFHLQNTFDMVEQCDRHGSLSALCAKLDATETVEDVISLFDKLINDWSLIYYQKKYERVFVARDVFGRKSLLCSKQDGQLVFSPFAIDQHVKWMDVPAGTVTLFNLSNTDGPPCTIIFHTFKLQEHWAEQCGKSMTIARSMIMKKFTLCQMLPTPEIIIDLVVRNMINKLRQSVQLMLFDIFETKSSLSISFSGGVDSLLITHIIAQCIPLNVTIDLVNVSFGKPEDFESSPDRPQSIRAYNFLRAYYPDRRIRLILTNVEREELQRCRVNHIARAISPSCLVLDDSIGCVQWFAARGEGYLYTGCSEQSLQRIRSDAKIVVVGSGADELFGGYMRHRTIFNSSGREAVLEELTMEIARIGERNLSRDDRVVSIHGKDLRSPFLSDTFVEWVVALPLELKTDLSMPRGIGEKKMLRLGLKMLGTPESLYCAPKRAMQFGTRIAKFEDHSESGDDICSRLMPLLHL